MRGAQKVNPAGYLLYLVAIFVPGLGIGELLGVWKKERSFIEAVGYVVGLGLAGDTLVMFVKSSGLQVGDVPLLGVTMNGFYAIVILGAACYAVSAFFTRKATSFPRPSRSDALVLLMMLIQSGMILLFFQKYPIFPEYNSADFGVHVNIVQSLLSSGSSMPGGILYYGIHYQLALGVLLTGGVPLIVVQRIGAILAILGTPIVFLAASRIFGSRQAGLVSSFLYSLTATIWFAGLFDTGLYPNFFGVVASLFVLTLAVDIIKDGARLGVVLAYIGAVGAMFLSHYSVFSVIPAVLALPLILLLTRKFQKRSILPPLILVIPAGLAVAAFPGLLGLLSGFLANAGGNVIGGTYLSGLLSSDPVIANMATITYYDLGFVLLLVLSVVYAWHVIRERDALKGVPLVWFLSVVIAAPFNPGAWRLSYVGLVPLLLMASWGLVLLLPSTEKRRKHSPYRSPRGILVAVVMILLLAGSWGVTMTSDAATNTQLSAQAQQNVYDSILWFANNTKSGGVLSVSDYRYLYAPQLIGRDAGFQFFSAPLQAIPFARSHGFSYIAVTLVVTASLPPVPGLFPWNNFPVSSTGNLTLVYSNDDVRLYKIP